MSSVIKGLPCTTFLADITTLFMCQIVLSLFASKTNTFCLKHEVFQLERHFQCGRELKFLSQEQLRLVFDDN